LADQPHDDTPPICNYEGSTYRTDFWEGQGREYEDLAERWALRRLLPPAGQRILDIGAGFGRLAGLYGGYDQVILLDYSRSQLAYARQNLGDERFIYVAADVYHLPWPPRRWIPPSWCVCSTTWPTCPPPLPNWRGSRAPRATWCWNSPTSATSRTCSVTCSAGAPTPTTPPRSSSPRCTSTSTRTGCWPA
jgi:SAM-dependent methyltransferase